MSTSSLLNAMVLRLKLHRGEVEAALLAYEEDMFARSALAAVEAKQMLMQAFQS